MQHFSDMVGEYFCSAVPTKSPQLVPSYHLEGLKVAFVGFPSWLLREQVVVMTEWAWPLNHGLSSSLTTWWLSLSLPPWDLSSGSHQRPSKGSYLNVGRFPPGLCANKPLYTTTKPQPFLFIYGKWLNILHVRFRAQLFIPETSSIQHPLSVLPSPLIPFSLVSWDHIPNYLSPCFRPRIPQLEDSEEDLIMNLGHWSLWHVPLTVHSVGMIKGPLCRARLCVLSKTESLPTWPFHVSLKSCSNLVWDRCYFYPYFMNH